MEEEDAEDPAVEDRLRAPPLASPATGPGPSPLPVALFLPATGKGEVEAGLMAELCLLSGATVQRGLALKHNI